MEICDYGCGEPASYTFKNGKKCCSKSHNSCPAFKKRRKQIPWNKGKIGVYSDKTIKKMSEVRKGSNGYWIGKKRDVETIRKISENHANVSGRKNPNWKGGYSKRNIPRYENFVNKLTIEEDPQPDQKDKEILTVVCTHCKQRFIPLLSAVQERVRALNGKQLGEQRLYCSKKCKQECSIFNKHTLQNGHPKLEQEWKNTEGYNIWRQEVLKRANYKCEYCGEKATIAHHIRPQKLEPFFSFDPDNGIACCSKCHYRYGHKTGTECSTGNLASRIC